MNFLLFSFAVRSQKYYCSDYQRICSVFMGNWWIDRDCPYKCKCMESEWDDPNDDLVAVAMNRTYCIAEPTPEWTPEFSPEFTPGESPLETPEFTPEFSPEFSPEFTPWESPLDTPWETLLETPFFTLPCTPYESLVQTPSETFGETAFPSPEITADLSPWDTPAASPLETPIEWRPPEISPLPSQSPLDPSPSPFLVETIEERQVIPIWTYAVPLAIGLAAFFLILIICLTRRKKTEGSQESSLSTPEIIALPPPLEEVYSDTIFLTTVYMESDPFQEDFQISDEYFDAQ